MGKCQILLTNDDGIHSPGLWAAAEALSELGYVTVAAPRDQCSGMGRSLPMSSDGIIRPETLNVRGKPGSVCSLAHANCMRQRPDQAASFASIVIRAFLQKGICQ